ncbi:gem-associated protein 6-like isoform X2 [Bacillus rossius redtenbacheri]|uniref:gem-associated protein 6-like isoform X2 n=1 Tax=Bacillus rossius redtenbacheri TaxID=93214 RepID=UPI002FDE73CC
MSNVSCMLSSLNPLELKNFVQKYVEIGTIDGKKYVGTVFTVDPITTSIILMNQEEGKVGLSLFPGQNIESLELRTSGCVPDLEHLFPSGGATCNTEEVESRAARLVAWLVQNRVPVRQDGPVLRLEDVLEIHPPYGAGQCYSTNETVLSRVQVLVSGMPEPQPDS